MAARKITNEVLEAHVNCKTKGHLKLAGRSGTMSDYEAMTAEASRKIPTSRHDPETRRPRRTHSGRHRASRGVA
jgi:outer membrane protease